MKPRIIRYATKTILLFLFAELKFLADLVFHHLLQIRYSIHHRHTFNNICIHPRKIVLIFTYVFITMYVHIIVVITCRGRAVTNVGRTCGPTPLLAIYAIKCVYTSTVSSMLSGLETRSLGLNTLGAT